MIIIFALFTFTPGSQRDGHRPYRTGRFRWSFKTDLPRQSKECQIVRSKYVFLCVVIISQNFAVKPFDAKNKHAVNFAKVIIWNLCGDKHDINFIAFIMYMYQ